LSLEIVRVTERAAVAAARLRGRGAEKKSDQAAVDAMRRELSGLAIDGTVVIGEGEMDEAPMLFIGEKVGTGSGPKVDIAVDPLEGTTLCAKNMPGAIATLALAQNGTLLHAPDIYMTRSRSGRVTRKTLSISTRRPTKTSSIWPRLKASSPRRSPL
jgi:fructose-1,6-bisphosphatase II / sedoheptulose-1,7-bisphosphatase